MEANIERMNGKTLDCESAASGLAICSWCKSAEFPESKYTVTWDMIAGIDKRTGMPVCRKCLDSAMKKENMLLGMKIGINVL